MVASKTDRRIILLRVKVNVTPAECEKPTSLIEILAILKAQWEAGTARCHVSDSAIIEDDDAETDRDEKNQIYIADFQDDENKPYVTLLINRGDPNAVSPALLNPSENDVEYISAGEKQTPGASAHLVIFREWTSGFHRGGYEKMSGASTSLTQRALNTIVARVTRTDKKYTYVHKTGKGKTIKEVVKPYKPFLILERMPSEKLVDDIEKGELSGFTLTKKVTGYGGIAKNNEIKYEEQKLVIHAKKQDASLMKELVAKIEAYGKTEHYESIQFHLSKLPFNQSSNPTISLLDEEDAAEMLYARARVLSGFTAILEGIYKNIFDELEKRIAALVQEEAI